MKWKTNESPIKFGKWLLLKGQLGSFDGQTRDLQVFDWIDGNSNETCPILEKSAGGIGGFVRYPAECEKFVGEADEKDWLMLQSLKFKLLKLSFSNCKI